MLDCARGTGRHLLWLGDLDCEVYGSDISPSMLVQARQSLESRGIEIPLREADFRYLPENFLERFDAILCMAAISYMQDEAQFLQAFEKNVRYNILDLSHSSKGTELKTWSAELTVLLRDDHERLLRVAGFRQIEFYGSYAGAPYDKNTSNQMIVVAQK